MALIDFSEEACFSRIQSRVAGKEKVGIKNKNGVPPSIVQGLQNPWEVR
jgi:hypothetical protein